MLLDELSTYIEANSTLSEGTDLFLNHVPATASDTNVALYESGGIGPSMSFGGVEMESPSVQVVARSTTFSNARVLSQVVWNLFTSIENQNVPGTTAYPGVWYVAGKAQQSPFSIGTDSLGRYQVSCNYFLEKEPSST